MSTSYITESTYTQFTSDIQICSVAFPNTPYVFLSSSTTETSYFNNNVQFYKNILINGTITNSELNNNTTNINSISGQVSTISSDVNKLLNVISITGDVASGYNVNILNNTFKITKNLLTTANDIETIGSFYNNGNLLDISGNTANINTISGKTKYITSANGNTLVNSSIYIQHYNNPLQYVCKLANDYNQLSYILSNLTISGNVLINGKITNTEVNNNTTNINTISGNINTISGNVNTISGNVNTISGNLNNLLNVITITGSAQAGYTINIGNALTKVYINGDLYYNGDIFLRKDDSEGNQVGMEEYINQMF